MPIETGEAVATGSRRGFPVVASEVVGQGGGDSSGSGSRNRLGTRAAETCENVGKGSKGAKKRHS